MQYILVDATTITELTDKVEELLVKGWQLYEGPIILYNNFGCHEYFQAMTKE